MLGLSVLKQNPGIGDLVVLIPLFASTAHAGSSGKPTRLWAISSTTGTAACAAW
jgi:hypothetical protein